MRAIALGIAVKYDNSCVQKTEHGLENVYELSAERI